MARDARLAKAHLSAQIQPRAPRRLLPLASLVSRGSGDGRGAEDADVRRRTRD